LPHAHDVGGELGNEVDDGEEAVPAILARKHDRAASLDLRHQVIADPHRSAHYCVPIR
jgi:hypothetical protein